MRSGREPFIELADVYTNIQEEWRRQSADARFSESALPSSFFGALWLDLRDGKNNILRFDRASNSPKGSIFVIAARHGRIIRVAIRLIVFFAVIADFICCSWTDGSIQGVVATIFILFLGFWPYRMMLSHAPYQTREARALRGLNIWLPAMFFLCLFSIVILPLAGIAIVYPQHGFGAAAYIVPLLLAMRCVGQSPNLSDWLSQTPAMKYTSIARMMRVSMSLLTLGLALSITLLLLFQPSEENTWIHGATVVLSSLLGYALSRSLAVLAESAKARRQNIEDLRYISAKIRKALFKTTDGSKTLCTDLLELDRVLSRNMFGGGSFSPRFASYEFRYLLTACAIRCTQSEDITIDDMPLTLQKPLNKQDRIWGWGEEGKTEGRHEAKSLSRRALTEAKVNKMSQAKRRKLLEEFLSFCVTLEY